MNNLADFKLVSAATPIGHTISYETAPCERIDYIRYYSPVNAHALMRVFKKDVYVDSIVERLSDACIYYIESRTGGDELYYFGSNGRIFHDEKVWSHFHPFLDYLPRVPTTAEIEITSYFVGSRNNYTHQLLDFLPKLLYQSELNLNHSGISPILVYGRQNPILESLAEFPSFKTLHTAPSIFLSNLGRTIQVGSWNIRCVRFRELILVKHLSIFKSFELLRNMSKPLSIDGKINQERFQGSFVYLSRTDSRVINQNELEEYLRSKYSAQIYKNMHCLKYAEKISYLSLAAKILMPPGSDNINGLCFSSSDCHLYQMISVPVRELLNSPYTSYASMRYLLPFLHRLDFIEANSGKNHSDYYSGHWDLESFASLDKVNYRYKDRA